MYIRQAFGNSYYKQTNAVLDKNIELLYNEHQKIRIGVYIMSKVKRDTWASRGTFILASIGSAVGLGNAWRFPGLAAKHGGGTF